MKTIKTKLPYSGYWDTRQGGRAENQDNCGFLDTPHGLIAVVCDGMGGGPAGLMASSTAVQKIVEYVVNAPADMLRTDILRQAVDYAHEAIIALGTEQPQLRGMGTTVTAVLINDYSAVIAHVGDSRIYHLRRGQAIFRTADHSMVAELVRNKTLTEEQARLSSQSNIITRALGGQINEQLADVTERAYERGDRFVLCTDGIWGMMPEPQLVKKMAKTTSPSGAVDNIVLEVDNLGRNDGNTHDNLTKALIKTKKDSILKEKMSKKALRIIAILAALCLVSIIANSILIAKLNTPDPKEQQVKELNEQLSDKSKQIETLQSQVGQLKSDIANERNKAADAKMDAANEKAKAAEKAKAEAEAAAERAKAEAQKAQDSAAKAQQAANEIAKRRTGVINNLKQAQKRNEDKERQRLRTNAINELKTLAAKDPKNKATYNDVIQKLNNSVAKQNKDDKGHYAMLIKQLEKIK